MSHLCFFVVFFFQNSDCTASITHSTVCFYSVFIPFYQFFFLFSRLMRFIPVLVLVMSPWNCKQDVVCSWCSDGVEANHHVEPVGYYWSRKAEQVTDSINIGNIANPALLVRLSLFLGALLETWDRILASCVLVTLTTMPSLWHSPLHSHLFQRVLVHQCFFVFQNCPYHVSSKALEHTSSFAVR